MGENKKPRLIKGEERDFRVAKRAEERLPVLNWGA